MTTQAERCGSDIDDDRTSNHRPPGRDHRHRCRRLARHGSGHGVDRRRSARPQRRRARAGPHRTRTPTTFPRRSSASAATSPIRHRSIGSSTPSADGPVDLIHTAGVIHPATSMDEFDAVNHVGTRNVMDAARRHGVRRVVHVSSNSPFGTNGARNDRFGNDEPYHPYLGYGRSKKDGELAVLDAVGQGLNAVMVRPPWFYGPHQPARQTTFFTMVKNGKFPILGDGGQVRSMTYIDNLVEGIVRAELVDTEPGRGWWIADAEPYTVNEIVETVGDALRSEGFEVKPNTLPVAEPRRNGRREDRHGDPAGRQVHHAVPRARRDEQEHRRRHRCSTRRPGVRPAVRARRRHAQQHPLVSRPGHRGL